MAGTGPAPKLPEERRNKSAPQRGEWIDLEPLKEPVLPELSRDVEWPAETVAAWNSWREDPVTSQYGPADISYALDTIRLHAAMTPTSANEVRLRMESLGLTPKGRQDRRWRVVDKSPEDCEAEPKPRSSRSSRRRAHLTAVK